MNAIVKDQDFLDALKRSPAGEKIAEQQAREQLAKRRDLADQLAAIAVHEAAEWPRLTAKIDEAVKHVIECERRLIEARNAAANAQNARSAMAHGASLRKAEIENALRETASPLIAEFRLDMHRELDAARKALDVASETRVDKVHARTISRSANNMASIDRRVRAIMSAMDAADEAAKIPDQSKIAQMLDGLRAALPRIERAVLPPLEEKK